MRRCGLFVMLGILASALTMPASAADGNSVTIMTAASAKDAMAELGKAFKQETGVEVKIVPGGSNALAAQIMADAPADLFLSANQEWADTVKEKGYVARIQPLLTNALVLIVPVGNPARIKTPADLSSKAVGKLALAGEHVPCGKYGQKTLTKAGIYDELVKEKKIARGQDVRITLSYVEQGEAEAGIVYATDALITKKVEVVFTFDPTTFDPIVYPLVLLKSGEKNPAAVKLYDRLLSPKGQEVFAKHGFVGIKPESK